MTIKTRFSLGIVLVVNLLIRIPRMLTPKGLDGFLAIWEARLILDGRYFQNGESFFTLLGMTPFSGYPILLLFILSFFLLITAKNITAAILLYDLTFTVIFVLSAYYLSSELKLKKSAKIYFIILLTTLPNILTFSYYTSSARYPFFAVLPFLLAIILKFNKEKKIKYILLALALSIILNFIHRMAIILFAIIGLSILFYLIDKIFKRDFVTDFHNKEINNDVVLNPTKKELLKRNFISFLNYFKKRFWVFGIVLLPIIGFIIFGLDFNEVFYTAKFNIYCYIQAIIDSDFVYMVAQPLVDQWFHYGVSILLFVISVIILFIPKFENILNYVNRNPSNLRLLYLTIPFLLIYQLIYSIYYICYIVAILGTILIQYLDDKRFRHYLWPATGLLVGLFITLYHFLTSTKVLPYLIVGLFLISISVISIFLLSINKTRKWLSKSFSLTNKKLNLSMVLFLGIIVFNSLFIVDRSVFTLRGNSIREFITEEEKDIAEFLRENGFGTFDSFDNTVSVHIAALSGWYFIQDQHNRGVFLIENRSISDMNCEFILFLDLSNIKIINCTYTDSRSLLYRKIFVTECYSIFAIMLLKIYNLKYFISSRHYNSSFAWQYTVDSAFIKSLYGYVPIVKTTENYYVWNTSTLYS